METLILDRPGGTFLVGQARLLSRDEVMDRADLADSGWGVQDANPYITWIEGDFVEGDKPNSNKQFWTAGDLEMAEYSIRYAPLNIIHKWQAPVGFYVATRNVPLRRANLAVASQDTAIRISGLFGDEEPGSMKIQALAGMWSHIFPMETKIVERSSEEGTLFFSMECTGSHLKCSGDDGCGETFAYDKPDTHCAHLLNRTSVRHIVNPVFRGGALIIPPVKPGWKGARAQVLSEAVMTEAAAYAEAAQEQYSTLQANGVDLTASAWEHLMGLVIASANRS